MGLDAHNETLSTLTIEPTGVQTMRTATAYLIAPILALTGFRFGKEYRWGVSNFHRGVDAVCSTVLANITADKLSA